MRRPSQVLAAVVAGGLAMFAATAVVVLWAPDSGAQTPPIDATVTLESNQFKPDVVNLPRAGMSVQWVHKQGQTPHSVTFDEPAGSPGAFDYPGPACQSNGAGGAVNPDDCYQQGEVDPIVTFESGGTFKYHCKIHAGMIGSIVVAGGAPPTVTSIRAATTTTTKAGTTNTTVGTLTTTSEVGTTTSSSTVDTSTTTTLGLTTQTTAPGTALGQTSKDDDEPSALLKTVGVILLVAVGLALIPAWRRLT